MKLCIKNRKKSAFSLIELSIVLIIIGLLIAGVTGGASLIKSSELRAVMSEARAYATSVNGFYNQFNYLPGDFGGAIGNASVGDADGTIEYANAATPTPVNEGRAAWYQMKGAGIIDTSLISAVVVPTIGASVPGIITFGSNVPASKIKGAGWDFDYNTTTTQNVIVLTGAVPAGSASNTLVNGNLVSIGIITPTDALAIDTKIDDGSPVAGKVRGVLSTCYTATTGPYLTSTTTRACALSYQIDINS